MPPWLDRWLFRRPFTGAGARRYVALERPGFGDLDRRLARRWHDDLNAARVVVDLGAGPGSLSALLRALRPDQLVIELEPSADFRGSPGRVRARGEALPLADASVDLALCLSSIRHVRDRRRTLAELRRVVRPGGVMHLVELDPSASADRVAAHARLMRSRLLAIGFGPLVVGTAPSAADVIAEACAVGWRPMGRVDDPIQPLYDLRLT